MWDRQGPHRTSGELHLRFWLDHYTPHSPERKYELQGVPADGTIFLTDFPLKWYSGQTTYLRLFLFYLKGVDG